MKRIDEKEKVFLNKIVENYAHNCELLSYEEVLCDRKLTNELTLKNAKMEKIAQFMSDTDINSLSDEQEILLQKLLNDYRGKQAEVAVELECKEKGFLLNLLRKYFEKLAKENEFDFYWNEDKTKLYVSGVGALKTYEEEAGRHRGKDGKKTEEVFVYAYEKPKNIEISFEPEDLKIDIYHSSGAGGQNVNKVATAVRITHLKSGIVASCQTQRYQLQNKKIAMEELEKKVKAYYEKFFDDEIKNLKLAQKKQIEAGKIRREYNKNDYPFEDLLGGQNG